MRTVGDAVTTRDGKSTDFHYTAFDSVSEAVEHLGEETVLSAVNTFVRNREAAKARNTLRPPSLSAKLRTAAKDPEKAKILQEVLAELGIAD